MAQAAGKLKLSLDEVSQTFDLSKEAGIDLSNDPVLVNEIGQEIIDFMVDRAKDGRGLGGVKLKSPYSKAYSESLEFKAFGKNPKEVNMTLTGDMLGNIDIADDSAAALKIAVGDGVDTLKAFNHNVGDTLPKRPFFGVTKSELKDIISNHESDFQAIKQDIEDIKQRIKDGVSQGRLIDLANSLLFSDEEA